MCGEFDFFFNSIKNYFLFLCLGITGGMLFGEDICSCGNVIGKFVVFGWVFRIGGYVFFLEWEGI